MPNNITRDELDYIAKRIKNVMKFNKKFYKNQEFGKRKKQQVEFLSRLI